MATKLYLQQNFDDIPVILCADMGTPEQAIVATTLGALSEEKGGRLNCLVFPAGTGEVEEKAVLRWKRGE
jgi:diphthamide biosynthesis methyltransferase